MQFVTDLHIHSRYSRACSKNLTLPNLAAWARSKGIHVIGTSDFTHPAWRKDIAEQLEPAEQGLFKLKKQHEAENGGDRYEPAPAVPGGRDVRFMLTTELSCIYKKNGRTRRLHLLVFVPTMAAADAIIAALEARGCNLRADGRPILGMDAKEIARIALEADERCLTVPAHAWTPWFSVFGSQSGFDSLEECFEELTPHIHAIETGLSSDPTMNRRLSTLDDVMLISNSDAHGLRNLGREANVFTLDALSYDAIADVLRRRQRDRLQTIEFFPEEGKYHVDGHRACEFWCEPEETARLGGKCPKCGKPLTRGVLGRVHALADRSAADAMPSAFRSIIPLEEVIAASLGVGKASKKVFAAYKKLLAGTGPEFFTLLDAPLEDVLKASDEQIAAAVDRMRRGQVQIRPGYDGVFGKVAVEMPDAARRLA